MFISPLPDDDFRVVFSDFAQRHFIKRFARSYKGKQWLVTEQSIFNSLRRVHALTSGQQVDELKNGDDCLLFKYDFAVAKTNVSAKASGNRCVVFLDIKSGLQTVLLVYGKTDLPKNQQETQFIMQTVQNGSPKLWAMLSGKK